MMIAATIAAMTGIRNDVTCSHCLDAIDALRDLFDQRLRFFDYNDCLILILGFCCVLGTTRCVR